MSEGLKMKYFVLKPSGISAYASASREEMFAYAKSIISENPGLSRDIWEWASEELAKATERKGEEERDES